MTEVWPQDSGLTVSGDSNGLAVSDFDRDGDLDAMIAVNDDPLEVLRNEKSKPVVAIELVGKDGNQSAIGASIVLEGSFGKQRHEVTAGGSYLSQSSSRVTLSAERLKAVEKMTIHWPDGTKTERSPGEVKDGVIKVEQGKTL